MPRPWNDWYHVHGNTYGTWLPGSDLGFRTRHHRRHIEGDYRNPPPPGLYRHDKERSYRLMRRHRISLSLEARRLACEVFIESFQADGIEIVAVCVDDHHFHALIRCRDHEPRHWVGRAKGRAARSLSKAGLVEEGGVWGKRCGCRPIKDRSHQVQVVRYILDHRKKGAFARFIRSSKQKPTPRTPTP